MEQMIDGGPQQPQEQVEHLMGRCMLRRQRYEPLMKAMLARHEVAGKVDSLEAKLSARVEAHTGMTLGGLTTSLFESYVVADVFEHDLLPEAATPTDRISMAFSSRVAMEPEGSAETRASMAAVLMRNELVHHITERLDLASAGPAALPASLQLASATLRSQPPAAHEPQPSHEQPLGTQHLDGEPA